MNNKDTYTREEVAGMLSAYGELREVIALRKGMALRNSPQIDTELVERYIKLCVDKYYKATSPEVHGRLEKELEDVEIEPQYMLRT